MPYPVRYPALPAAEGDPVKPVKILLTFYFFLCGCSLRLCGECVLCDTTVKNIALFIRNRLS